MKVTDEMVERGKGPLWGYMDDVEDAPPSSALVREILEAALANVPEPDIINQEHRRMADELRQLQDAEVASRRRAETAEARNQELEARLAQLSSAFDTLSTDNDHYFDAVVKFEAKLEKVREWYHENSGVRPVDVGMDALLDILESP